jgi:polysaccharide biosynthesis transport protein
VIRRASIQIERSSGLGPALDVWARRKWLALLIFSASFGAIGSLAVSLPDLYRSTATVLVEREQVSEAFIRPSVTAELETRIQMIREQVMSRARLTELIERLDLYPESRQTVPLDTVIERMRRDIQLELKGVEQPMSGRSATIAFAISYLGRDPHTVANVANALAGLYVKENTKIREGQAVRTAEFLRSQMEDIKKELDEQERRTSAFRLTHAGELPQQVEANLASLERLNTQLRLNGESQLRVIDRRERLEKELSQAASAPVVVPEASPEEQKLSKLREQLADLQGRFTDEYPDVLRLRFEVEALEQRLARAPAAGRQASGSGATKPDLHQALSDVEAELRSLKQEEQALRQAIGGYEQRVENAPRRQQDLQALSRDYETTKERYDTLLKRYEEAQLAENLEQGQKVEQFRILDAAMPSRQPAAPNRLRILITGFMLAIGLAVAAVLAAEKVNTSFHTFDDLREAVTIPTLIRVPLILSAADRRRRYCRNAFAFVSAAAGLVLIVAGSYYVALGNEQIVRLMERGHL